MGRERNRDTNVIRRAAFLLAIAWCAAVAGQTTSRRPPAEAPAATQGTNSLDRELLEGLPPARTSNALPIAPQPANGAIDNKLAAISERMRAVSRRMAQHDTSAATQAEQQQITRELAALLEDARNQKSSTRNEKGGRGKVQAGAGTGNPAIEPAKDGAERIARGSAGETAVVDRNDLFGRLWGHLPDKMREQMRASLSEQFLPKYEQLIEEYYKRLAEEDSVRK